MIIVGDNRLSDISASLGEAKVEEVSAWIEKNIDLASIFQFAFAAPPPTRFAGVHYKHHDRPTIKINRLHWPAGASRWATFHAVVTGPEADLIMQQADAETPQQAIPFVMEDGNDGQRIETDLYPLDVRPLAGFQVVGQSLYLLTLVDERYYWHMQSFKISVTEGVTTWSSLFDTAQTRMQTSFPGWTLRYDTVPSCFNKPSYEAQLAWSSFPAWLDSIAAAVGMRIHRNLDGTVEARAAATCRSRVHVAMDAARARHHGGEYLAADTVRSAPAKFTLLFERDWRGNATPPSRVNEENLAKNFHASQVNLADLDVPDYANKTGFPGSMTAYASMYVLKPSYTNNADLVANNTTDLDALTTCVATEWYRWHAHQKLDVTWPGTFPWAPEGGHDVAWSQCDGTMTTRVYREDFGHSRMQTQRASVIYPPTGDDANDVLETYWVYPIRPYERMGDTIVGQVYRTVFDDSNFVSYAEGEYVWQHFMNWKEPLDYWIYHAVRSNDKQLTSHPSYGLLKVVNSEGQCCSVDSSMSLGSIGSISICPTGYCFDPETMECYCCHPSCCDEPSGECFDPITGRCVTVDECPPSVSCSPDGVYPCSLPVPDLDLLLDGVSVGTQGWNMGTEQWEGEVPSSCNPDLLPNGLSGFTTLDCVSGAATVVMNYAGETHCTPSWNVWLVQCSPLLIRGYVVWSQYPGPGAPECPCIGTWQLVELQEI